LMRRLKSIFFHALLFVDTIVFGLVAIASSKIDRTGNWAHLVARSWGNFNLRAAGVKVEVHGLERLKSEQPCVYAANHQSLFDVFVVLGKLPVQFRWLAKEELFRLFVMGRAMKATGYIPINRSDHRKAFESINLAAQKVKNGVSIVIFPEGTRSEDGVLQEFKKGGFILAIKSQQPIVPISISGSHRVVPRKNKWIIQPGTVRMTIGLPIPTAGCTTKERDLLIEEVRESIRRYLTIEEGGIGKI
jgi:1-acyl-sn-glycerol-3-phosphate acyltransferase